MTFTGEQLRDEGMSQVDETHTRWRDRADKIMQLLIISHQPFSANDFNQISDSYPDPLQPHHPSSIGALFGAYAKRGKIVRCGTDRPTKASSHARTYAQWISADAAIPAQVDRIAELEQQLAESERIQRIFRQCLTDIVTDVNKALESVRPASPQREMPKYLEGFTQGLVEARNIIDLEIHKERS